MSITYLYVKECKHCGLLYFGKTTKIDKIYKYRGSGCKWIKHLNKHNQKEVNTIKLWEFADKEKCSKFALRFSQFHKIVESKLWANLIPENGINGGTINDGRVTVVDDKGQTKMISLKEFKDSPELKGVMAGTVAVKDKNGVNYRVSKTDPRYLSGEFVNNRSRMIYARNLQNDEVQWIRKGYFEKRKAEYEFIGECPFNDYEGYAKTAKGGIKRRGKSYHTPEQIEKFRQLGLSNKGKTLSKETKEKISKARKNHLASKNPDGIYFEKEYECPNCNKLFVKSVNNRTKNKTYYCSRSCACSMSRKTSKISCPNCGIIMDKSNYTKYHKVKCIS